ncbi:MAG TPA: hypothetical protein VKH43_14320 [Thermoanaerobaculia bacterium]|nr:hypothetical protein [Thermoanaerobaculia bacterium]
MRGIVARRSVLAVVVLSCSVVLAAEIAAIANGSFESNGGVDSSTFTGWTVANQTNGSGNWYVQTGTTAGGAAEICTGLPVPAPTAGSFAAMTNQSNPGSHVLYQNIAVPAFGATLSFDLFLRNNGGAFVTPATLDFTVNPNQQARVDIMSTGSAVTDVGAGVLKNVYATKVGDPLTSGYTKITMGLQQFAGQTVRLRFAEVDNLGCFQMGVDNVQLLGLDPIPTLSLPMLALLAAGLAALALWLLRRP